jgi:DNA-binding CsgD family transcriptional regulator
MFEHLLAITAVELRPALDEASAVIARTFGTDKVDVFVHQPDPDMLVAMGASKTPMSDRQHRLARNRLPGADNGCAAWTFQSGESYTAGHANEVAEKARSRFENLARQSTVNQPIMVDGEIRGVLQVDSAITDFFTDRDRDALAAVAGWMGLIVHRAELVERATADAARHVRRQAGDELAAITQRQLEIAILIAAGLSNAAIARQLVITEGTVANHVENILRRLNLSSRTQIAVWTVERGLYRSDHGADERDEAPSRSRGRRARARADSTSAN